MNIIAPIIPKLWLLVVGAPAKCESTVWIWISRVIFLVCFLPTGRLAGGFFHMHHMFLKKKYREKEWSGNSAHAVGSKVYCSTSTRKRQSEPTFANLEERPLDRVPK